MLYGLMPLARLGAWIIAEKNILSCVYWKQTKKIALWLN